MRAGAISVFILVVIHLISASVFGQVFPVLPNGVLPDNSFYRATLTVDNFSSVDASCTIRVQQNDAKSLITTFSLKSSSWLVWRVTGPGQVYVPSYAVLGCDQPTSVQVRYAFYSSESLLLGEANVPPSSPVSLAAFIADSQTDNTRMALAIANDSDKPIAATVTVYDQANSGQNPPIVRSVTIVPRSTVTQFVDEITGWKGSLGVVTISASDQFYVTGLRFTGAVFSTLPPLFAQ